MEAENEDLEDDFQQPLPIIAQLNNKRRKLAEAEENDISNKTEESTCSLCQNSWSIAGLHRIVSLNCGHLFGKRTPALRQETQKRELSNMQDIWPVWPKKLTKPEPLHIKQLQEELDEFKKQELEQVNAIKRVQAEIKQYRNELSLLSSSQPLIPRTATTIVQPPSPTQPLTHEIIRSGFIDWEVIQLSTENASRVLAFTHTEQDIIVSIKHNGKYGLKKIKIEAPALSEFIGNHDGLIRDLKCSTHQNMALSTGSDKTLKLTSMDSNSVVQSYQLGSPGWSCSFDSKDSNLLYCGLGNGSLLVYDIRNTNTHLHNLKGQKSSNELFERSLRHSKYFATKCRFYDANGQYKTTLRCNRLFARLKH
ncbi:hypothetical protein K501DRAFT_265100 [Backusella circina FSU 941]|nr:hypothetical protein K501DRAFT_265100 [Backusella circina FSU 941]